VIFLYVLIAPIFLNVKRLRDFVLGLLNNFTSFVGNFKVGSRFIFETMKKVQIQANFTKQVVAIGKQINCIRIVTNENVSLKDNLCVSLRSLSCNYGINNCCISAW